MEIYLVRHTTPDIKKGICYGQSDLGITNSFQSEVEKIHQQIPIAEIDKVYSSPLRRCKLLAKTFNNQITFDDRLKELHFGDWELKPWDDIDQKEIDPWMKDFVNVQVPNGESYVMLQQRVMEFYNSLHHISTEKIVIVAHAGPMRTMIASLQEIELKDSFSIKIGYGEVIKI